MELIQNCCSLNQVEWTIILICVYGVYEPVFLCCIWGHLGFVLPTKQVARLGNFVFESQSDWAFPASQQFLSPCQKYDIPVSGKDFWDP